MTVGSSNGSRRGPETRKGREMRIKPAAEPRPAAEGSAGLADEPMADEAASTGDSRLSYTVDEVAEMLGLSRSAVYECVARGETPARRVGR